MNGYRDLLLIIPDIESKRAIPGLFLPFAINGTPTDIIPGFCFALMIFSSDNLLSLKRHKPST